MKTFPINPIVAIRYIIFSGLTMNIIQEHIDKLIIERKMKDF
ncbi:hypothetical protein Cabther_A0141 [Chloracidobacterium thermophilum B]|uniref:Uncharacterized protein n=1 Tax=Chloracidobacterium thermophilum (strain B) TaxID=981222 RepID=G2LGF4_CHLTF|nr:hypothetical protein Cabther_A0141 [Chloracidobacterium thermophilum B]